MNKTVSISMNHLRNSRAGVLGSALDILFQDMTGKSSKNFHVYINKEEDRLYIGYVEKATEKANG